MMMVPVIDAVYSTLREMFGLAFLVRACLVGALVSVCAALLGPSLVLKRYSMIGDGLSHAGFGALAVATALNAAPLSTAIPLVMGAAFLLLRLGERHLIKGDAAIALVSTGSLALGVVIISLTTGMNTDVCAYMFGSILSTSKSDVYLSVALSVSVLVLFILFYHQLFAITFDESFARTAGLRTGLYNMLIAFLTAITIVLGMRMMGAMLISALIIFPALTAMRVFKKFKTVCVSAVCVSLVCFFTGIVLSYVYGIPTGAAVVLVNIGAFLLFSALRSFGTEKGLMKKTALILLAAGLLSSCAEGKKPRGRVLSSPSGVQAGQAGAPGVSPAPVINFLESPRIPEPVRAAPAAPGESGVIEIGEKLFIAQTNDVYLNPEDYLGKRIKLEGLSSGNSRTTGITVLSSATARAAAGLTGPRVSRWPGKTPPRAVSPRRTTGWQRRGSSNPTRRTVTPTSTSPSRSWKSWTGGARSSSPSRAALLGGPVGRGRGGCQAHFQVRLGRGNGSLFPSVCAIMKYDSGVQPGGVQTRYY
jgi:zinc transport system permease protein